MHQYSFGFTKSLQAGADVSTPRFGLGCGYAHNPLARVVSAAAKGRSEESAPRSRTREADARKEPRRDRAHRDRSWADPEPSRGPRSAPWYEEADRDGDDGASYPSRSMEPRGRARRDGEGRAPGAGVGRRESLFRDEPPAGRASRGPGRERGSATPDAREPYEDRGRSGRRDSYDDRDRYERRGPNDRRDSDDRRDPYDDRRDSYERRDSYGDRRGSDGARSFERSGRDGGGGGGGGFRQRSAAEREAREAARKADKALEALRTSQGCCYGCGAPLQTSMPQAAGYVPADKYAAKKVRRQLDKVLCRRCSDLCNGAMVPGVQDFQQTLQLQQLTEPFAVGGTAASGGTAAEPAPASAGATAAAATEQPVAAAATAAAAAPGASTTPEALELLGRALVTPEQLRAQLKPLAHRAAVVVLLVDLLDASATLMARVRDMVGRNPLVLVGTKLDLLPEGCRPRDVAEWLSGGAAAKRLNVLSVHLVSSHTGEGMSAAVARICKERLSRDVFVVGAANVGKSAFVRAMLKEMAAVEPAALGTVKYLPVESAMPGTTLGLIPLRAFSGEGMLYDTPGVHLHHRIPHMLAPPQLKLLHPRWRLKARVPPLPAELAQADDDAGGDADADDAYDAAGGVGAGGADGDGAVRRGLGGLKIVDHAPTDEYGMPITGLDAGVRRRRTAAADGSSSAPRQRRREALRATYMWSDLVRLDILAGPPGTALVFYGPASLRVAGLPYSRAEGRVEVDYKTGSRTGGGGGGPVLTCADSVAARGGLVPRDLVVPACTGGGAAPAADVAVSGLPGWVTVWAPRDKKDIKLRVWVPRGVEVALRPPLPVPMPSELQRALRGERDGGEGDGEDEAPEALDEWAAALSGGIGDPTSDPNWWEAMAALKDEDLQVGASPSAATRLRRRANAGRRAREEEDEEEQDEDEEEQEADGRRVVVTARVEDILRRPRLDVLAQMDLGGEEDEEAEGEGADLDGPAVDGAWDPFASSASRRGAPARKARSPSGLDGPAADGAWNPFESSGTKVVGTKVGLRAKAKAKAAQPVEEEEEVEDEEERAAAARRRRVTLRGGGGAPRRLGRRREVVTVVVGDDEDEEGGEVA